MAERIFYSTDGIVQIRGHKCDMGEPYKLDIVVETDGDIIFSIMDERGKRVGEVNLNNGASRTPGLAAKIAPIIREYAQNQTKG